MRFQLIDRILEVEPGRRLRAVKNLARGEEYLADHFPTFPVMPGVLMLQAVVEAGSWLMRVTEEFRYSVVVLREAKNIRYGHFMVPGYQLELEVELHSQDGSLVTIKGKGLSQGESCVTARVILEQYNLETRDTSLAQTDERLKQHWQERYAWLTHFNAKA